MAHPANLLAPWPSTLHVHLIVLFSMSILSLQPEICLCNMGNETDRISLLEFKVKIATDPYGILSSWNDSVNFCKWHGITCSSKHHRVASLKLQGMRLSGTISSYTGNLTFLRFLNLADNRFYGEIPQEVGRLFRLRLHKRLHNLSDNTLRGEIQSTSAFVQSSSEKLLIMVLSGWKVIFAGWYHEGNFLQGPIPPSLVSLRGLQRLDLSRNNLSRKILKEIEKLPFLEYLNLSFNNLEGEVPTKGVLNNITAVLLVGNKNLCGGASKSFIAECKALRNIRHRNLVKILTYCSRIDFKGNDFKALVYDFMANGSLEMWLHPQEDGINQSRNLNLLQRLHVAIDLSSAMHYLHGLCETPIIHCDLKPSNILLDTYMIAHVGRRPTDEVFIDGLNLHNFFRSKLPRRVMQLLDPKLIATGEIRAEEIVEDNKSDDGQNEIQENNVNIENLKLQGSNVQKCVVLVLKIELACSAELPADRMNMSDVTRKLNIITEAFVRARTH
ncbi:putative receptor-like protein kinase At3g47110 [Hevea brasiliensis]|uniref:putative receptor-like protein kinase At3g47110 n=1 Tax=Hevea brasiliensis TaxID=3981 RepID=UPI0025F70FBC|nr:putative receptor-like protein kinase At3g47110 [Hevea brasiliensis]